MNGELGYAMAFLTGLLGAGHCLGMCSGIAGGLSLHQGWGRPGPVLTYHGSRIAVYVALGTLGAALGRTLVQTGALGKIQGQLMILAGTLILVLGLGLIGVLPWAAPARYAAAAKPSILVRPPGRWSGWGARLAPALGGLANGLVPCSLVYSVATRATASADPAQAALLMLCFGLGTLPVMGTATASVGLAGRLAQGLGRRLAGGIVILLGAWTLYEGLTFYEVMRGLAD